MKTTITMTTDTAMPGPISINRRFELDVSEEEYFLVIHALQSHARTGDNDWPGEAIKAAAMRDGLMNVEDRIVRART